MHSNLRLLSHSSTDYIKGPNRLWDVQPEISDIDVSINALTHLNLNVENSDMVRGPFAESSMGSESLGGGRTQSSYPNSLENLDDLDLEFQENSDDIFDSM